MEKRTREILALVLLVLLGIVVACAMGWYILVGHNWNQAATHIDDMVGSMDGYTVVAYEGVVKRPKASQSASSAASVSRDKDASSESPQGKIAADDSAQGDGNALSEKAQGGDEASGNEPSQSGSSSEASSSSSSASGQSSAAYIPVQVDDVAASYREKGAQVIVLPSDALFSYEEPTILLRNGKRIGVASFSGKYRYRYPLLRARVRYLHNHSVDFVVVVAKDKALLKHNLQGIDLLVLERDAQISESGEYHGQTLCVDSPYRGEVQAVIMSPSGVLTSRTVKEL